LVIFEVIKTDYAVEALIAIGVKFWLGRGQPTWRSVQDLLPVIGFPAGCYFFVLTQKSNQKRSRLWKILAGPWADALPRNPKLASLKQWIVPIAIGI